MRFQWPWEKLGLTDADRKMTKDTKLEVEESQKQVARVHKDVVQIIYHNGIGETIAKALAIPTKEGR